LIYRFIKWLRLQQDAAEVAACAIPETADQCDQGPAGLTITNNKLA